MVAGIPYYINNKERTINQTTVYPNNYKYSTIRAYLNGNYEPDDTQDKIEFLNNGFLQTAFTANAQTLISNTTVVNDGLSTTDSDGNLKKSDGTEILTGSIDYNNVVYYPDYTCANTIDKIFLVSEQEVTDEEYFFPKYDIGDYDRFYTRRRIMTDYALALGGYRNCNYTSGNWWLRSPGYDEGCYVRGVDYDGLADDPKFDEYSWICDSQSGIIPALSITLEGN